MALTVLVFFCGCASSTRSLQERNMVEEQTTRTTLLVDHPTPLNRWVFDGSDAGLNDTLMLAVQQYRETHQTDPLPMDVQSLKSHLETLAKRKTVHAFCRLDSWEVHPETGPHIWLSQLIEALISGRLKASDFDIQLKGFIQRSNQYANELRRGAHAGYGADEINIRRTAEQLHGDVLNEYDEDMRAWSQKTMTPSERRRIDSIHQRLKADAYPLINAFRDLLETELIHTHRKGAAITNLPRGAECYQRLVELETGGQYSPMELHRITLQAVHALKEEMKDFVGHLGHPDLDSFVSQMSTRTQDSSMTYEVLRQHHIVALERARKLSRALFKSVASSQLEIRPTVPLSRPYARTVDYEGAKSMDTGDIAHYRINPIEPETRLNNTLPAYAAMLGYPGLHFISSAHRPPSMTKAFIARFPDPRTLDGWALYALWQGMDIGLYQTPLETFGAYTVAMRATAGAVIDSGIHTQDWSRIQAIDYLSALTGHDPRDIINQVDWIIAYPGYGIRAYFGYRELLKLREDTLDLMGDGFDLQAFHEHLTMNGPISMNAMRVQILNWLGRDRFF